MNDAEPDEAKSGAEEIARALREILGELKEINTSLKSIARSQANQTSVQKALGSRGQQSGEGR